MVTQLWVDHHLTGWSPIISWVGELAEISGSAFRPLQNDTSPYLPTYQPSFPPADRAAVFDIAEFVKVTWIQVFLHRNAGWSLKYPLLAFLVWWLQRSSLFTSTDWSPAQHTVKHYPRTSTCARSSSPLPDYNSSLSTVGRRVVDPWGWVALRGAIWMRTSAWFFRVISNDSS